MEAGRGRERPAIDPSPFCSARKSSGVNIDSGNVEVEGDRRCPSALKELQLRSDERSLMGDVGTDSCPILLYRTTAGKTGRNRESRLVLARRRQEKDMVDKGDVEASQGLPSVRFKNKLRVVFSSAQSTGLYFRSFIL